MTRESLVREIERIERRKNVAIVVLCALVLVHVLLWAAGVWDPMP